MTSDDDMAQHGFQGNKVDAVIADTRAGTLTRPAHQSTSRERTGVVDREMVGATAFRRWWSWTITASRSQRQFWSSRKEEPRGEPDPAAAQVRTVHAKVRLVGLVQWRFPLTAPLMKQAQRMQVSPGPQVPFAALPTKWVCLAGNRGDPPSPWMAQERLTIH